MNLGSLCKGIASSMDLSHTHPHCAFPKMFLYALPKSEIKTSSHWKPGSSQLSGVLIPVIWTDQGLSKPIRFFSSGRSLYPTCAHGSTAQPLTLTSSMFLCS